MRHFGQTWDYWEWHLTVPMMTALHKDMLLHPSADTLMAMRYRYKPPSYAMRKAEVPKPLMGQPEYEP